MQNFVNYVSPQFQTKVKTTRNDNGAEFNMPPFYLLSLFQYNTSFRF